MYLLNVKTKKLSQFSVEKSRPKYAILSHRWGEEETTFHEIGDAKYKTNTQGFRKIIGCCSMALSRGLDWIWIDTCCIDKKSSAELSQAINSMYKWYANAEECYVYLSDVSRRDSMSEFRSSVWFTRAWTLQELLAPSQLIFFNASWERIGTMKELVKDVSSATGIAESYLRISKTHAIPVSSIATKMSWASRREASLSEDVAYSLLGIFDVNMPLLYGEGDKAFKRLQIEIIQQYDDESIFAWNMLEAPQLDQNEEDRQDDDSASARESRTLIKCPVASILALSPRDFKDSGNVGSHYSRYERKPYAMTNKGLQIEAVEMDTPQPASPESMNSHPGRLFSTQFPLACHLMGAEGPEAKISIPLITLHNYPTFWRKKTEPLHLNRRLSSSKRADPAAKGFSLRETKVQKMENRMIYIGS